MIRKPGRKPAGWMSGVRGGRSPVSRCRSVPGAVSGTRSVNRVADDRHRRGGEPHRVEPGQAEDRLTQERTEGQAKVDRQRAEVDRLAATLRRREVADRREERPRRRRPRRSRAATERPRTTATSWRRGGTAARRRSAARPAPAAAAGRTDPRPNRRPDAARGPRWRRPRSRCRRRSRRHRSGPAANREATGSTTLPDVKNTSAAANSAANAGVKSRGAVGHPAPSSVSSRSAAAYGSSRWAATSSRTASVLAAPFRRDQRRAQPLAQDRPDLRLRPGPPRATALVRATGRPVPVQRRQELGHAFARRGGRDHDLGALRCRSIGGRPRDGRDEHRAQLGGGPQRPGLVALVHDDQVRDLEQARLDRLDLVAHLGGLEDHGRVGRRGDLDLALAGPDRLDEHEIEPGGIEHRGGGRRRRGEAAGVTARRHRADEDVRIAGVGLHPHAVAEQRATGDR